MPNVTLFESDRTIVPVLPDCVPAEIATPPPPPPAKLAVITELFDIPNVTPFEFENTTVPDAAVCVPAAK